MSRLSMAAIVVLLLSGCERPGDEVEDLPRLSTGAIHRDFCLVLADGRVACTDHLAVPEVPRPARRSLHVVPDLEHVTQLAVLHSEPAACALDRDGAVQCWGLEHRVEGTLSPIEGLPRVRQLASTTTAFCALGFDGQVWCWSGREPGPLDRTLARFESSPVQVDGLPPVSSIGGGAAQMCALAAGDAVWCWGWVDQSHDPSPRQLVEHGVARFHDNISPNGVVCLERSDGADACLNGRGVFETVVPIE